MICFLNDTLFNEELERANYLYEPLCVIFGWKGNCFFCISRNWDSVGMSRSMRIDETNKKRLFFMPET
jgi:hypothetical protein